MMTNGAMGPGVGVGDDAVNADGHPPTTATANAGIVDGTAADNAFCGTLIARSSIDHMDCRAFEFSGHDQPHQGIAFVDQQQPFFAGGGNGLYRYGFLDGIAMLEVHFVEHLPIGNGIMIARPMVFSQLVGKTAVRIPIVQAGGRNSSTPGRG